MMTKKDFIALAEGLRMSRPVDRSDNPAFTRASAEVISERYDARYDQWCSDRESVITTCYESNPRFDRARFTEWTER